MRAACLGRGKRLIPAHGLSAFYLQQGHASVARFTRAQLVLARTVRRAVLLEPIAVAASSDTNSGFGPQD